jgi:DNA-binding HxlR family transcriptional regulator
MEWLDADPRNCPVGHAVDLLGEKWTLLIVRDALNGVSRFDDFRVHLGVSDAVLADRLRKLVDGGILERRPYQDVGRRTRQEYHPTERGWDLRIVLASLRQWGELHLGERDRPSFVARHLDCGGDAVVELRCVEHPDEPLAPDELTIEPGPAARPAAERLPSRR